MDQSRWTIHKKAQARHDAFDNYISFGLSLMRICRSQGITKASDVKDVMRSFVNNPEELYDYCIECDFEFPDHLN